MTEDQGRRAHDRIPVEFEILDDENPRSLTVSEIKELKRLAHMSRTARAFTAVGIGIVSLVGIPAMLEFIQKHVR